jgi:hypothetical protein
VGRETNFTALTKEGIDMLGGSGYQVQSMVNDFIGGVGNLATPSANAEPQVNRDSLDGLAMRVDRQNLIIQALLMLLLEKNVIADQEFRNWLAYADELDGRADGKLTPDNSPVACPACKRNNPSTATRCQYCDQAFAADYLDHRNVRHPG